MPTIWLKFGFYKYLEKMTLFNFTVFLFEKAAWSRWAPSYYFRDRVSDVTTRSKTLGKCEKTFTREVDLVDTTAFLETIHRFKYRNEKPFYSVQMRSKERKKASDTGEFVIKNYLGGTVLSLCSQPGWSQSHSEVVKINISKIRRKEITRKDLCK